MASSKIFDITNSFNDATEKTKKNVEEIAKEHRIHNRKFRDNYFDLSVNKRGCLYRSKKEYYNFTSVKRVSEIFKVPQFFIHKSGKANSPIQGEVNSCWFIASLAVIGNDLDLLEKICVARDEKVGVYGFDGEWVSTIIDDQLFINGKDEKGNWKLTFAKSSVENETWQPLIEKAFAKLHGDYESISGGFTGHGMEDLTGGVYTSIFTSDILDKDKFWTFISKEINKDDDYTLFACARHDDADLDAKGTVKGHAYSVLRVAEFEDEDEDENGKKQERKTPKKLIMVRNPWGGRSKWTGAWSDGSEKWTPERMKKLEYKFGNNGAFWMTYEDFLLHWEVIDMCRLFDSNWHVYSTWINYNVIPRSAGKFNLYIKEKGEYMIVLQQRDDKYFHDPPKFRYQLKFRLYEQGKINYDYKIRSRLSVPYGTRSTNLKVDLEPGSYEIIPDIDRKVNEHSDKPRKTTSKVTLHTGTYNTVNLLVTKDGDEIENIPNDDKALNVKRYKDALLRGKTLNDEINDEINDKINDEEDKTDEVKWEMSLGLRVYSKCTHLILGGFSEDISTISEDASEDISNAKNTSKDTSIAKNASKSKRSV
ncbi:17883_t:CDS:2 [Cetraspora pellucida]|uniref:17883_t:CDS:1 n=1 Tax=Cetraspora pellucida TaxID=1433469 RepID=A0ACA9KR98_9GLOM|nr:17883_t:CDS:2 [Cetraspora pellucida]